MRQSYSFWKCIREMRGLSSMTLANFDGQPNDAPIPEQYQDKGKRG